MHYNHSEVESTWQKLWEEHKSYKTSKNENRENFTVWKCSPILRAKFIWGMCEIMPLAMLCPDTKL